MKKDQTYYYYYYYYYSWFIKNQDSQPTAELLTILQENTCIHVHLNTKYKFTNKLYNKSGSSHIESQRSTKFKTDNIYHI